MAVKHRVLIIGVGSIGERHLRCFQRTERAETSICECDAALRTRIAETHRIDQAYSSVEEAMVGGFTAAVIATPAPLHVPLARRLAERNCHVLIEKPLGVSLDGTTELMGEAEARRLTVAVAYVLRCHPALAAAKHALNSGKFGRPLQAVAVAGQNFPFFRPAYRHTYYARRAAGGGAVQDALTHTINAVQWLVGPVDRVQADLAHLAIADVDVEDTVHVLARHGDILASYAINQHQSPNEHVVTVACERGTIRVSLHENSWSYHEQPQGNWTVESFKLERDDLFERQANNFLDAVEGVAPAACTLQEGIDTLKTNLAILAAAEESRWTRTDR